MKDNIFTDYYLMESVVESKSHRYNCVASTKSYEEFEQIAERCRGKAKMFYCYYTNTPEQFSVDARRKAEKIISSQRGQISSLYVPDIDNRLICYGDINNSNDAIIVIFSDDYVDMEIFIARGYKNDVHQLWMRVANGDFDEELDELRERVGL